MKCGGTRVYRRTPLPVPLTADWRRFPPIGTGLRGEFYDPSTPGAAVAALPCPGLQSVQSVALSGQKTGSQQDFQAPAVSRERYGHARLMGEGVT